VAADVVPFLRKHWRVLCVCDFEDQAEQLRIVWRGWLEIMEQIKAAVRRGATSGLFQT